MELEDLSGIEDHVVHEPALAMPRPYNPSSIGYPATLPVEIALRAAPIKDICAAYQITREEWVKICQNKNFIQELEKAQEMLSKEGVSFKVKARMQSDELLKTSWNIIHDSMTPPAVKADMIKATVRWAGYDAPPSVDAGAGNGFSININFGDNTAAKGRLLEATDG